MERAITERAAGSDKTALVDRLCKRLRDRLDIAMVTNDIYTRKRGPGIIKSDLLIINKIALSGVTANAILHNPEGFSL